MGSPARSDRQGGQAVQVTRDQELWGVALWVEKQHGADGPRFIAEQVGRLVIAGEAEGVAMWRGVAERFGQLGHCVAHC
jgi:hypothetical protein